MKKFSLQRITLLSARFISSAEMYDSSQCTANSILEILFSVEYPPECNSVFCKARFVEQVESRVSQSNNAMDLSLTSTDRDTWNTNMTLCSFNQTEPGMCISLMLVTNIFYVNSQLRY